VQRTWALLPAFLSVARASGRPLEFIELAPVRRALLEQRVEIVRRSGVDLGPIDVTTEAGAERPLAWISTRRLDEMESRGSFSELEVAIWPDGSRRVPELTHYHGYWLDWRG
jgi:hypothetical protein